MTRYSNPGHNSGDVLFHWFYMHETKFHCEKKVPLFSECFPTCAYISLIISTLLGFACYLHLYLK